MCRKSTFAEAQNDAKVKDDKEFVTKNNPAVSLRHPTRYGFWSD